ncbi:hypothetical protein HMPREF3066_03035 [Neisseria sp. HMSC03D10]|nr:hypothetical protein HMPREF3066_03035 [Neisseria sp. HMSC03D10]
MMDVNGLIFESFLPLFDKGKYTEAIEILHQAWDGITDKNTQIPEQIRIKSWLGHCYFQQLMKAKDVDETDKLFEKAVEYYQQALNLTEQLEDEKSCIQEKIKAQSWLSRCYFKKFFIKMKETDEEEANKLFEKTVEHYQQWLELAKKLKDQQDGIQEQGYAQSYFGYYYFKQAKKTKNVDKTDGLLKLAIKHYKQWLELFDQQRNIWQQVYTQFFLGICYFVRAKKNKNPAEVKTFFKQASEYFLTVNEQIPQLNDEKEKLKKRIHPYLRDIDYFNKNWNSYFKKKKQEIQESLFKGKISQPQDAVSTVLAALHITPAELGAIPMAHYTSPHVCHKLFGIDDNETANPMRLGSSTYMNDPSEGKALLDLLNQQDLELENKADGASHNAFFTCFSSRVNDLNQFRLYGKEGGVEASGCCLVFNKNGDWLKEADISAPFRSLINESGRLVTEADNLAENLDELMTEADRLAKKLDDLMTEDDISDSEYEKLPLYQVAYVAYEDEYISEKKCGIWLSAPNKAFDLHQNLAKENLGSSIRFTLNANISRFGIRLKPVGNEEWHQFRLKKLKEALEALIGFFKDKSAVSDEDKEALEYIRYLFKDFAFRDEEEFRLLVIKPIDSEEIEYCETTQSVYIPYADIRNLADEVILGTNYEKTGNQRKAEVFRYQMKQKCPNVKVSRSTLPINPPNK